MANKTFNVGIVGYGLSAKVFHIPFLLQTPQLKFHSIVQRSPKEGNSAPNDFPNVKHYTSFDDLVADSQVDLVIVTTPPNSHFELTKAALEAGKHVLTEKPFVPTAAEADQLVTLAREKQRQLIVYQNRRWDTDFLTVQKLISEGTLGRIVEFNTHFERYRPNQKAGWKAELPLAQGGSALYDLGTHLVDQAYTLFGTPQSVHGRLLSQRSATFDFENPDSVAAELTYPDGKLVTVRIGVLSTEVVQPRFWVRGSKGSLRKSGLDPQETALLAGKKASDPDFGREPPENATLTLVGDDGELREKPAPQLKPMTYSAFYAALARSLESGREEDVPVKATEARDVLRILEAIMESAKTGRDVTLA